MQIMADDLKEMIDLRRVPNHIAIIMDGNGRWAKEKGHDRLYGHYHGVESVRNILESCAELNIPYLTLYAFSTESWDWPKDEVDGLMELLVDTIRNEVATLNKNNIKLPVIGDIKTCPASARQEVEESLQEPSQSEECKLILSLTYSSTAELLN